MQRRGVNVVGSANMDLVVRAHRFPMPGETLLGGSFATFPGGKGANQAVAIGRLGGQPRFLASVGGDAFGDVLRNELGAAGVDTTGISIDPSEATGVALITVTEGGENTIVVASGANGTLSPEFVRMELINHPADLLLVQLEVPLDVVRMAFETHTGVAVLNPAPAQPLDVGLLSHVDVLTPNETECEALTGIAPISDEAIHQAIGRLLETGVGAVVLTRGAQGCAIGDAQGVRSVDAFQIEAVDTTGAGDAFSGTLAHFLSLGESIDDAARFACAVAAISVTKQGAQSGMPDRAALDAFLKNYQA